MSSPRRPSLLLWCVLAAAPLADAVRVTSQAKALMQLESTMLAGKNPIRKVITLMKDMQKELEAEGKKEKELYEKFMCFCNGSGGELTATIEKAKADIEEFSAKLKSEEASKTQTTQELADHKVDRAGAKSDLDEATSLREKEVSEYSAASAEQATNIEAIGSAITTLEKATAGASFVQLPRSPLLKEIAQKSQNLDDYDRKGLIAFIEQDSEAPASGQIIGIMKQMKDEFETSAKEAKEDEEKAAAGFAELKDSKEKEIEFATESIEKKTVRSGELAVSVVQTKDALEDATEDLSSTEKNLAQLQQQCATKSKEYAARSKSNSEEIAAISEAIGILNGDDGVVGKAEELIQQRNAPVAFLQQANGRASRAHRAQALLAEAASRFPSSQLRLVLFAMKSKLKLKSKGKVQKFAEVVKMVDDMIVVLEKEQVNDEKQKAWCQAELDKSADEQAKAEGNAQAQDASIEEANDAIATLDDEISTLGQEIQNLDKAVAEATAQRKEEHAAYSETMTLNGAAAELIKKAKARLEKFYKPALIQESSDVMAFVQTDMDSDAEDEDADSESAKAEEKRQEERQKKGDGVLALMDMLVQDIEGDNKDAENEEKTAQKDYAELMSNSQASRAEDVKSVTDKEAAKAQMEGKVETLKEKRQATTDELLGIAQTTSDLHGSCDFIMKNLGMRKEARGNEIDSLKNAKAILSGA